MAKPYIYRGYAPEATMPASGFEDFVNFLVFVLVTFVLASPFIWFSAWRRPGPFWGNVGKGYGRVLAFWGLVVEHI